MLDAEAERVGEEKFGSLLERAGACNGDARVAEEGFEVGPDRNTRVAPVGLGSGGGGERIESLPQPAEVEPGEDGADQDASAPVCSVEAGDGDGGERAEEKGESGDPFFGSEVRRDVDGGGGHGGGGWPDWNLA